MSVEKCDDASNLIEIVTGGTVQRLGEYFVIND